MFHLWCLNSCSLRVTQSNCVFSSFTIHRHAWIWLSFFFANAASGICMPLIYHDWNFWAHDGTKATETCKLWTWRQMFSTKLRRWTVEWFFGIHYRRRKFASFDVFVFEHVPIVTAFSLPLSPSSDLLAIKQCVLPFFHNHFWVEGRQGRRGERIRTDTVLNVCLACYCYCYCVGNANRSTLVMSQRISPTFEMSWQSCCCFCI